MAAVFLSHPHDQPMSALQHKLRLCFKEFSKRYDIVMQSLWSVTGAGREKVKSTTNDLACQSLHCSGIREKVSELRTCGFAAAWRLFRAFELLTEISVRHFEHERATYLIYLVCFFSIFLAIERSLLFLRLCNFIRKFCGVFPEPFNLKTKMKCQATSFSVQRCVDTRLACVSCHGFLYHLSC